MALTCSPFSGVSVVACGGCVSDACGGLDACVPLVVTMHVDRWWSRCLWTAGGQDACGPLAVTMPVDRWWSRCLWTAGGHDACGPLVVMNNNKKIQTLNYKCYI